MAYCLSNTRILNILKCNCVNGAMPAVYGVHVLFALVFLRLTITEIFSLILSIIQANLIFDVINMQKYILCIFIVTFPLFKNNIIPSHVYLALKFELARGPFGV